MIEVFSGGKCRDALMQGCWWAENKNGVEFKHHLARVPDYLWLGEDGMKMQTFGSQLWDSTLATQAIILSDMPEEYGDSLRKANFYIKESQIKNNPCGDFSKMGRQISKGAWTCKYQFLTIIKAALTNYIRLMNTLVSR